MNEKRIKNASSVLFFIFVTCLVTEPAFAHRVNIFAWIEADTVHTKSKFASGREVKGGKIIVTDPQGNELLTGLTDDQGEFSFKAPGRMDLRIVLVAGQGHQADWVLHAGDMGAVSSEEKSDTKVEKKARVERATIETKNKGTEPASPASGMEKEELEAVIESILDRKLKPIYAILAEIRQEGPGVKDIFAGIGYILGLVGIAAYVHSRKKKE
jgi:nickel transport protein